MEGIKCPNIGLLDYLALKAGCMYLSDLHGRRYWFMVQHTLREIDCNAYSQQEWDDALTYLVGNTPESTAQKTKEKLIRSLSGNL